MIIVELKNDGFGVRVRVVMNIDGMFDTQIHILILYRTSYQ